MARLGMANALVSSESLLFTGWPEKGLWEVPKPVPMMPTEVNSLCTNPRLLIALHSPHALLKTGLHLCHPEKSRDSDALHCRVVRSLKSGLSRKNREIRACFAYFGGNGGGLSLQSRLRGGEGGIRTLGTGVSPYNGLANRRIRPLCHLSGVRVFTSLTQLLGFQIRLAHYRRPPATHVF